VETNFNKQSTGLQKEWTDKGAQGTFNCPMIWKELARMTVKTPGKTAQKEI
jgi:hypothetical protein